MPNPDLQNTVINAALALSESSGSFAFTLLVPNTTPPLYLSLHEGPVFHRNRDTESVGGLPGSPELRTLAAALERSVQDAVDLEAAQNAVYAFMTGLRRLGAAANES